MRAVRRKLLLTEKKKNERKRKPVVMSPITLIPDWSVVLTEKFTSTISFSFSFAFFLICFLIILSVCSAFFLLLCLSPSLPSSYLLSFLFQKYLWSFVDFFSFFLFTSSVSTAKRTHRHTRTHSLFLYLKK